MELDESILTNRAASGDMDALSELLAEHGPRISRQLSTQIRAVHRRVLDAEDVMQVTYLEAFLRIRNFSQQGRGSFAAWLMQIATNNLRDAIRELERQKRPPVEQRIVNDGSESGPNALLDRLGWTSTTPSRSVGNAELQNQLLAALDRLPPDYGTVLRLYDLEGGKPEEVAMKMGRSVGAVHMLRARAIDQLRTFFASFVDQSMSSP